MPKRENTRGRNKKEEAVNNQPLLFHFLFYLFRLHTEHMAFLISNIIFLSVFLEILVVVSLRSS